MRVMDADRDTPLLLTLGPPPPPLDAPEEEHDRWATAWWNAYLGPAQPIAQVKIQVGQSYTPMPPDDDTPKTEDDV